MLIHRAPPTPTYTSGSELLRVVAHPGDYDMLAVPSTRCAHVRFGLLRGLSVPICDEAQGWGPPFPLVVRVTVSCDVCPALARSEEFTHRAEFANPTVVTTV